MANGALVAVDTVNVDARRQRMRIAGLLTTASAFLLTTESAVAQKAQLPSTLGKTVKVESLGHRDTAPFTLLAVSPTEFPVARHGERYLIDEMTFTFFAEGPLLSIHPNVVHVPV